MAPSNGGSGGSGKGAHVLIVPSPSQGHTIPFMSLTKHLVTHGVSVTFVSSEKHIASLEHAKGSQDAVQFDNIRFVGLPGGPANFMDLLKSGSDEKMARMLADLLERAVRKAEGREVEAGRYGELPALDIVGVPCCIISDMFGGWTHAVAKKFDIPSHVLFTSPAACASMQLQIPKFIAEGLLPLPTSTKDGPVNIPGLPPFSAFDLPRELICDESAPDYKFYTRNTLRLGDATCILVNTFYELEKNVFDVVDSEILDSTMQVRKFVPIGPLLPAEHHLRVEDRHPAEKWLDNQKEDSVLYVAFGSAVVFSPAQILELTEGLESSGQAFVLVLQLPNGEALDKLSPGFEERTEDRGVVVTDWAPQVRILNHPATGAFMTHCGWNSALESISAGVPLIAWPMMAEQKMNCRFLVDIAKLAIEVQLGKEGFVEKEEVTRVVRLLMQESLGSDIHKHARKMQELAHEAMAPGGSSQKNMDDFVKELAVSKHKE